MKEYGLTWVLMFLLVKEVSPFFSEFLNASGVWLSDWDTVVSLLSCLCTAPPPRSRDMDLTSCTLADPVLRFREIRLRRDRDRDSLVLYPLARVCVPCSVRYLTPWALCWGHVQLVLAGDTCRVPGAACPALAPAPASL